jgi:putative spermidine/putrescine transport system substrate-binding protein
MFKLKVSCRFFSVLMFVLAVTLSVGEAADKITIASWGGAYTESQRKAYYQPFKKATGITVLEDVWASEVAKVRAMVETKNYLVDIIDMTGPEMTVLGDEGYLEQIDYGKLGLSPDDWLPGGANKYGVGTISFGFVFAYDGDRIKGETPKNYADFWNVKKWPGKRGVYKTPKYALEMALLADNVKVDKLYDVLGTKEGINRAFQKLDELKPYIIWFTTQAQAPQLLADKEVVMTVGSSGRFTVANQKENKNFVTVWNGECIDYQFFVIPKGDPKAHLALKFIKFASDPKRMAEQTKYVPYGPLRKDAMKYVDPKIIPDLPTAPQHLKNSYMGSFRFWADNREALTVRMQNWLAK